MKDTVSVCKQGEWQTHKLLDSCDRGEVTELLDDMLELQPTIFTSVPRLYNRIYDRVMGTIRAGNPVARRLFAMAYASKRAALEQGDLSGGRFGGFWDRLVFSKIKARLGGTGPVQTTASLTGLHPGYHTVWWICSLVGGGRGKLAK